MISIQFDQLQLWQFSNLSKCTEINHFVSGRKGGCSAGELGGLNLSFKVNDTELNVIKNRKLLSLAMNVTENHIVFPDQTHSDRVAVLRNLDNGDSLSNTDALITNLQGVCIAVMSADCVPILLYDKLNKAVGAVHAGWRGTVSKILDKTIGNMEKEFGTKASDLVVGIGPSISPEIYEVGQEVIDAAENAFGTISSMVTKIEGKTFFNLWEANKFQLISRHLNPENIEIAGICTYQNADKFFSARKSQNKAGRFGAGIVINPH
ncbi:MAG: peptidoglycan editing factor PgeF [Sporocytophaga sp.]|uniref:peptidoglycan editing factor PgeF n=1 Tax=Sporocytophaga sp. TaxID=2231183 RepID=UPI001B2F5E9E|nr:peptidoglycan editing factor PgeF [Sporocytophaga sp.]MBO9700485.1 peptidoglycan editing factor PgeF [Sporocytophaga sp.]